ncbi:MAG: YdiU family protein [Caulobacterales bacterium]|nr:YdiU family protein [Caulobacterales bacterium]
MPVSPAYRPDPLFASLGEDYAAPVTAARFEAGELRLRDDRAAARIGLETLTEAEWRDAFALFKPLPNNQERPLAQRYHGHQFRVYNPDIGDGRGFLFAQMRDRAGRLMDLGAKGSGTTPFSRSGDGRMTLQGAVREALISAALDAFGVPGCAILSLYETGERLDRYDEPSPARGAVMVRLQHSHVRIGTFQRHAAHERADLIAGLLSHCLEAYYPDLQERPEAERAGAFLRAVVTANAQLTARWMAAGFVHGVMNSDNMTVTGESFDYGPSRFLPVFAPDFTAAYFDDAQIYAYGRQPHATAWNLERLAECLTLVSAPEPLQEALQAFSPAYSAAFVEAIRARLGVASAGEEADQALAEALFAFLDRSRAPFEGVFFDWFGGEARGQAALSGPRGRHYQGEAFAAFRGRLAGRAPAPGVDVGHPYFAEDEPASLTIAAVREIWRAIDEAGDWTPFEETRAAIGRAREAYRLSPAQ